MSNSLCSSSTILQAQAILRNNCATNEQFNEVFPIVVAQVAAMKQELPSAPVGNIAEYIIEKQIDVNIGRIVGNIGACSAIKFDHVRQLAMSFYKFRYAMVHGGFESLAFATAALTGTVGDLVSKEAMDTLRSIRDDEKLSNGMTRSIDVLRK